MGVVFGVVVAATRRASWRVREEDARREAIFELRRFLSRRFLHLVVNFIKSMKP